MIEPIKLKKPLNEQETEVCDATGGDIYSKAGTINLFTFVAQNFDHYG